MSEMRMHEVFMVGRVIGDPIVRSNEAYFRFQADDNQEPFHCFCDGLTAKSMLEHIHDGDELSIQGKLVWKQFRTGRVLMIKARYESYGRKSRTLLPGLALGEQNLSDTTAADLDL